MVSHTSVRNLLRLYLFCLLQIIKTPLLHTHDHLIHAVWLQNALNLPSHLSRALCHFQYHQRPISNFRNGATPPLSKQPLPFNIPYAIMHWRSSNKCEFLIWENIPISKSINRLITSSNALNGGNLAFTNFTVQEWRTKHIGRFALPCRHAKSTIAPSYSRLDDRGSLCRFYTSKPISFIDIYISPAKFDDEVTQK